MHFIVNYWELVSGLLDYLKGQPRRKTERVTKKGLTFWLSWLAFQLKMHYNMDLHFFNLKMI